MAAFNTPLSNAAFLALMGMDADTKMVGSVPPQDDADALGIIATAAEQATGLLAGGERPASPDELEWIREDGNQFLFDAFEGCFASHQRADGSLERPHESGLFDILLTAGDLPVRLRVTNTAGHITLEAYRREAEPTDPANCD